MPLFKVTMSREIRQVFEAYVHADTETAVDEWASNVEDELAVGVCLDEDTWGSVDEIEVVISLPPGRFATNLLPTNTP